MSARLHQDDNWPREPMFRANAAEPPQPISATALHMVEAEPPLATDKDSGVASTLRLAAWSAAVCLLTVGPGAFSWEWCRIGGEALIAFVFAERCVSAVRGGTLMRLFDWRVGWNRLAFGWLAVACVSTAWSYKTGWGPHSPYPTILYNGGWSGPLRQLTDTIVAVMGYFAALPNGEKQSPIRRLTPILLAGGSVLVLCGVEAARNILMGTSDPRLEATFTNPNLLGAFLCIALPVSVGIASNSGFCSAARVGSGALAAGLCAALWLSGSRGALLGCVIGLGYLSAYGFTRKIKAAVARDPITRRRLAPAFLAIVMLTCVPALSRLSKHFATSGGAHVASDDQRRVAWRGAILIIREHPVTGLGIGSYPAALGALNLYQANPETLSGLPLIPAMHLHAHDLLLEFWAERGAPGLLLACGLIVATLLAAFRCLRWRSSSAAEELAPFACAALLATLTQNIADYTLWYAPLIILFWQLPSLMTSRQTADNR